MGEFGNSQCSYKSQLEAVEKRQLLFDAKIIPLHNAHPFLKFQPDTVWTDDYVLTYTIHEQTGRIK